MTKDKKALLDQIWEVQTCKGWSFFLDDDVQFADKPLDPSTFSEEFDFQASLAKFDKKEIFKEIQELHRWRTVKTDKQGNNS